jgi:hypothetical protein
LGDEAVDSDEHLACDGHESDFGEFAACHEALVECGHGAVAAGCGEGGHVQGDADPGTSTVDGAFPFVGSGVVVVGGDACEGGDLLPIDVAEFGEVGQEAGGRDDGDALLLDDEVRQFGELLVRPDEGGELPFQRCFGLLQRIRPTPRLR